MQLEQARPGPNLEIRIILHTYNHLLYTQNTCLHSRDLPQTIIKNCRDADEQEKEKKTNKYNLSKNKEKNQKSNQNTQIVNKEK